ncbi:MAG: DUF4112 domain-containing protein [Janthinobacterium lividum]
MSRKLAAPDILPPGTDLGSGLSPRLRGAGGAFRNENLELLSRVLDTWFVLPGTNIRFGLDGIIGFVPGIGDFLAGIASCVIVLAAYVRGVPLVTVARMAANIGIEVVVGAVPFLGNFFDIAWRANRRNYALLERSLNQGRRDTWKDWLFVGLIGLGLMSFIMLPFFLLLWFGGSLLHRLHAPGWR